MRTLCSLFALALLVAVEVFAEDAPAFAPLPSTSAQVVPATAGTLPPSGAAEVPVEQPVRTVSGEEWLPAPASEAYGAPPLAAEQPYLFPEGNGGGGLVEPTFVDPAYGDPGLAAEPGYFSSWFSGDVWDPWEGNVEFGLNGTDGNTETFNVRLGAKAKHKTEWLERTIEVTTIQKTAAGQTTANTSLLDGRLDWPMAGSRWNYFIHGLMESDQFKAFDYRFSADTGFGYEFIDSERTKLIGRVGLAGSFEVGGTDDEFKPELLFGGEFTHKVNDSNKLALKSDIYPNINDFGDFRLNSQASWELTLAKEWGLSMKWSLIDRFDSTPIGRKRNDLDYSTLLIWSF
jgi:putative salt-induced outer membrane protein YdiY